MVVWVRRLWAGVRQVILVEEGRKGQGKGRQKVRKHAFSNQLLPAKSPLVSRISQRSATSPKPFGGTHHALIQTVMKSDLIIGAL